MTEHEKMHYTLISLRYVMLATGFFLGMAYTAWVFDHMFGTWFSLFYACITGWCWYNVEKDMKDITND